MKLWQVASHDSAQTRDLRQWKDLLSVAKDMHVAHESDSGALWISEGDYFYLLNRYDDALSSYRQALRIYGKRRKASTDPHAECNLTMALACIGRALAALNQYDAAERALANALRATENGDCPSEGCRRFSHRAETFVTQASLHAEHGQFEDALTCCAQARTCFDGRSMSELEEGDLVIRVRASSIEADVHAKRYAPEQCISSAERVLETLEEMNRRKLQLPAVYSETISNHVLIGLSAHFLDDVPRASKHFKAVLDQCDSAIANGFGDRAFLTYEARALEHLVAIGKAQGEGELITPYLRRAYSCLELIPETDKDTSLQALFVEALLEHAREQYQRFSDRLSALEMCVRAQQIVDGFPADFEKLRERKAIGYQQIGNVQLLAGAAEQASESFMHMLAEIWQLEEIYVGDLSIVAKRAEAQLLLGASFFGEGRVQEALKATKDGVATILEMEETPDANQETKATTALNLLESAGTIAQCGDFDEYIRVFKMAVERLKRLRAEGWQGPVVEAVCRIGGSGAHYHSEAGGPFIEDIKAVITIARDLKRDEGELVSSPLYSFLLEGLGEGQLELGNHLEAEALFLESHALLDRSIREGEQSARVRAQRASVRWRLGQLYYETDKDELAESYLRDSIQDFNVLISENPTSRDAWIAKATATRRFAELHIKLRRFDQASQELNDCIALCKKSRDDWEAFNCEGIALLRLAAIAHENKEYKAALEHCEKSEKRFARAMALHPDAFVIVMNRGNNQSVKARAEMALNRVETAARTLDRAIGFHREALVIEDLPLARRNLILSLKLLAEVCSTLKSSAALARYSDALVACEDLIHRFPQVPYGYTEKANIEIDLAKLKRDTGDLVGAVLGFEHALETCHRLAECFPQHGEHLKLTTVAYSHLGKLFADSANPKALDTLELTVDSFHRWFQVDDGAADWADIPVRALLHLAAIPETNEESEQKLVAAVRRLTTQDSLELVKTALVNLRENALRSDQGQRALLGKGGLALSRVIAVISSHPIQ